MYPPEMSCIHSFGVRDLDNLSAIGAEFSNLRLTWADSLAELSRGGISQALLSVIQ